MDLLAAVHCLLNLEVQHALGVVGVRLAALTATQDTITHGATNAGTKLGSEGTTDHATKEATAHLEELLADALEEVLDAATQAALLLRGFSGNSICR